MMLFAVFCISAALVVLGTLALTRAARENSNNVDFHRETGPRLEGVAFIVAVLAACIAGLLLARESTVAARPAGMTILALTAGIYILSSLRSKAKLPPILADFVVVCAAAAAVIWFDHQAIEGLQLPFSGKYAGLGEWAAPITVAFAWAIARMTAALNRTPHVTGGYLGLVGLTLCIIGAYRGTATTFPLVSSVALAGAGLASLPFAMRRPDWNLGWSASLALGFLLAQSAVIGLWKDVTFAILALLMLVLGMPLLDVTYYRLKASRRGANVNWQEKHLRLHEALARRGLSRAKVSLLYLVLAAWLCALGVLVVVTAPLIIALRAAILALLLFSGGIFFLSIVRVLMRRVENEEIPDDIEAFGVRISPVTMTEAMDKIEAMIHAGTPHHVVTSDANAILRAQEDPEYAAIMSRAALITPDGYGVIWGARLMNLPIYERVTGVDMVTGICERAAKHGYRIFILGSEPGTAATAATRLMETYPGLQVVGTHHGMILRDEKLLNHALQQIKDARPDVLFVAMGIPLQEKFIAQHMAELKVPVALGVGGSFDVYSEKLKRAPVAVQRAGMEWLYRVWQEPWRWKRMGYVPRFMLFALKEWLGITHITRDQQRKKQAQTP